MGTRFVEKSFIISIYLSASAATFDLNKYIISVLGFQMHYLLIILQSLIIVAIILIQSISSATSFRYSHLNRWWLISFLLSSMMLTNMKALYYMPLSLFTLYKNTTIILVAILEYYFFNLKITLVGLLSFLLMIGSSLFGNTVDRVHIFGYAWMILNILSTAAYVLYLKKLMSVDMAARTESVFFTNLLSIPILSICSYYFDDFEAPEYTPRLITSIFLSGISAYLTSFSTAWAMRVLSSTSYSMIGAMNKLLVSASGFLIFNEKFEEFKVAALATGILAGMLYSIESIRKQRRVSDDEIIRGG